MGAGTLARGALLLAYPLLVYFGLVRLSPRWAATWPRLTPGPPPWRWGRWR